MRMWMVNPKYMCNKHLLGEHVECHMILGCAVKGKKMDGFVVSNCLEWLSLIGRHTDLSLEMESRGMNHKSNLSNELHKSCTPLLSPYIRYSKVNTESSQEDLFSRCPRCLAKYIDEANK